MTRISMQNIEAVDNGTDGVLFKEIGQQPFSIDLNHLPSFEYGLKTTTESPLCKILNANWDGDGDKQHQLYICRFFALLFPGMFGANPIVINQGEHRSGKTTAAKLIGWLLLGRDFSATILNRDIKDVETALSNDFLVLFDNADSGKDARSIEDLIAVASTGGSIRRRELYTTNTSVSAQLTSQVFFTSRGRTFDRNDVVDRCFFFKFAQFGQAGGRQAESELTMTHAVIDQRDTLMAEVIVKCQNILRSLDAKRDVTYLSNSRLQDFSRFCLAVADSEGWLPQMQGIFQSVSDEQKRISTEANPLHPLIRLAIGYDQRAMAKPMCAGELALMLDDVATRAHVNSPARKDPKSLAQLISVAQSEFKANLGLIVVMDKKVKRNLYSFRPAAETLAECIEEAGRHADPHPADGISEHPSLLLGVSGESTQSPTIM